MTKEEKIQILRETIDTKNDIFLGLDKFGCKTGIEIGVRMGNNLARLAHARSFMQGKLIGLDCWREVLGSPEFNDEGFTQQQLDAQFLHVVNRFVTHPHIEIVRDFSVEGSTRYPDGYFDFIYIDAAHDYTSVRRDLEAWWPKLSEGGIFSGHDYITDTRIWRGKKCEVYRAVNEFAAEQGTEVHHQTVCELEGGEGHCCPSFFIVK